MLDYRMKRRLTSCSAQISTIGMFGYVFAAFSEIGRTELVFVINGVSSKAFYRRLS